MHLDSNYFILSFTSEKWCALFAFWETYFQFIRHDTITKQEYYDTLMRYEEK